MPDEGNAEGFENDGTGYSYEMGHQEMEEGNDIDDIQSSANNEVEVEDLSEVPNQSSAAIRQSSQSNDPSSNERLSSNQQQIQSISSGTGNSNGNEVAPSTSLSPATISQWRQSPNASTSRQQTQHLTLMGQTFSDDASDDRIVPSTPTLYRSRNDAFSEVVSSPAHAQVPHAAARFTFGESTSSTTTGVQSRPLAEGMDDTRIDLSEEHGRQVATPGHTVPNIPQQLTQQSNENLINDSTSTSSTSSSISTVIQQDIDQPVPGSSTSNQEESQVPEISITDEGKLIICTKYAE